MPPRIGLSCPGGSVSTFTGTRDLGTNKVGTIWQSTATLSGMSDAGTPGSPAVGVR